jgi:hypothetical protein
MTRRSRNLEAHYDTVHTALLRHSIWRSSTLPQAAIGRTSSASAFSTINHREPDSYHIIIPNTYIPLCRSVPVRYWGPHQFANLLPHHRQEKKRCFPTAGSSPEHLVAPDSAGSISSFPGRVLVS